MSTKHKAGILAALALVMVARPARGADGASLVLHTVSAHAGGKGRDLNGVNPGFGVRMSSGVWAVQAGVYRNSQERRTVYALADWQPVAWRGVTAGLFAGTGNGYAWHGGAFVPVAGAVVSLKVGKGFEVRARVIPPFRDVNAGTVGFELGRAFRF